MKKTAIANRLPAVTVEWAGAKGKRVTKDFADAHEAKAFYAEKMKAGKEPKVLGEAPDGGTDAPTVANTTTADPTASEAPTAKRGRKAKAGNGDTAPQAPPAAPAAPKPPKVPGVSPKAITRAYYAGVIIRKHGHAAGVTPEMVAELDALYGRVNPVESEIMLRNGWHVVRAWTEATKQ
jgi:hypothetical protein